jgi:uncharacterized membrane protein
MILALLGLTSFGTVHTAISLVAVGAGIYAFIRDRAILPTNAVGKTYIITTVLTCLTGFPIFQHGGFGAPHALGIITLLVLGVAAVAARTTWFGRLSAYVETASYSATFFFHLIPGFTETGTRLPRAKPLFTSPEDPALQKVIGVVFVVFLAGTTWQVLRLRASRATGQPENGLAPHTGRR